MKKIVVGVVGLLAMMMLLCGCEEGEGPKLNGVYLSNYKIVGEKEDYGTKLAVEELNAGVKELVGQELQCTYGEKAGKKVIYIADSDSNVATYSIEGKGKSIVLSGPGITGRRQAVRELLAMLKETDRVKINNVEKPMFTLPKTAKLLKDGKISIGFIGDSVTTSSQAVWTPWTEFFEEDIKTAYPNVEFKTYNCAVGGRTSAWGDENIEVLLLENGFSDLVFVAIGTNDKYYEVDEAKTRASYISMIEKIYKTNPNAEIVFMLAARQDELKAIEGEQGGVLSPFISVMVEVTDKYNIPLIDPMSALYDACVEEAGEEKIWSDGWNTYMSDEVHPLEKGQELYGGLVWKQIEASLK